MCFIILSKTFSAQQPQILSFLRLPLCLHTQQITKQHSSCGSAGCLFLSIFKMSFAVLTLTSFITFLVFIFITFIFRGMSTFPVNWKNKLPDIMAREPIFLNVYDMVSISWWLSDIVLNIKTNVNCLVCVIFFLEK